MNKLTKEIILDELYKNRNKIRSFGVSKLTLFGSYARDEQTDKSDIDFLVEFEKDRGNYRDSLDILHFLEILFNKKIDIGEKKTLRKELKPYILRGKKVEATI